MNRIFSVGKTVLLLGVITLLSGACSEPGPYYTQTYAYNGTGYNYNRVVINPYPAYPLAYNYNTSAFWPYNTHYAYGYRNYYRYGGYSTYRAPNYRVYSPYYTTGYRGYSPYHSTVYRGSYYGVRR